MNKQVDVYLTMKFHTTTNQDFGKTTIGAIGFSNHTIGWFKSYLLNRLFRVNLENC